MKKIDEYCELAFIFPYRDRMKHYHKQMRHLQTLFPKGCKPRVLIIEQAGMDFFKRGWLFNAGIKILSSLGVHKDTCVVAHDIDMLASSLVNYSWCDKPIQLCSELSCFNDGVPYTHYSGGVVSASLRDWKTINGFSNILEGWGGEDDDLFYRFKQNNLLAARNKNALHRPRKGLGKCQCMNDRDHTKRLKAPSYHTIMHKKLKAMATGSREWHQDGLSNVQYQILNYNVDDYNANWYKVTEKYENSVNVTKKKQNIVFSVWGGGVLPHFAVLNIISIRIASPNAYIKIFVQLMFLKESQDKARAMGVGNLEIVACNDLRDPFATTRFTCYMTDITQHIARYNKIAMLDLTDTWMLRDIFFHLSSGLYVVAEPVHHPMKLCSYHKEWISLCGSYGSTIWNKIKNHSMICAGTIFGESTSVQMFLLAFVQELDKTKCNDQGVLNVMIWTNQFITNNKKLEIHTWTHEAGPVLSMNVAKTFNLKNAALVHTGDNAKARIVMKSFIDKYSLFSEFVDVLKPNENSAIRNLLHRVV